MTVKRPVKLSPARPPRMGNSLEELAFTPVRDLAGLVRTRKVSSLALTEMFLARLDARLHCVITLTKERALERAKAADKELAAGKYRGPLHGIPWGGKDLLAVKGMARTFADVDVLVAPSGDPQVLMTNLTGHPACIVPNGFRDNGTPVSLTFLGRLFGEAKLLAVARAYQEATDFHLRNMPLSV